MYIRAACSHGDFCTDFSHLFQSQIGGCGGDTRACKFSDMFSSTRARHDCCKTSTWLQNSRWASIRFNFFSVVRHEPGAHAFKFSAPSEYSAMLWGQKCVHFCQHYCCKQCFASLRVKSWRKNLILGYVMGKNRAHLPIFFSESGDILGPSYGDVRVSAPGHPSIFK